MHFFYPFIPSYIASILTIKPIAMTNPFDSISERLSNIEMLLLDIKHQPGSSIQVSRDDLLNVQQAADFLHLKPPTIYRLVADRKIPFSKRSQKLYFSREELTAWVQAGRRRTREEIEVEG